MAEIFLKDNIHKDHKFKIDTVTQHICTFLHNILSHKKRLDSFDFFKYPHQITLLCLNVLTRLAIIVCHFVGEISTMGSKEEKGECHDNSYSNSKRHYYLDLHKHAKLQPKNCNLLLKLNFLSDPYCT